METIKKIHPIFWFLLAALMLAFIFQFDAAVSFVGIPVVIFFIVLIGLVILFHSFSYVTERIMGNKINFNWGLVIQAAIALTIIALVAMLIVPGFLTKQAMERQYGCKSNLETIGKALEAYSAEHKGQYPSVLGELVPRYIERIPDCPASSTDTYSHSYKSRTKPDNYTLFCSGYNHNAFSGREYHLYLDPETGKACSEIISPNKE